MHGELLMLTAEQLKQIMPGLPDQRNREFLPFLQAAMKEFAIDAPARAAAFVAQLAHESGQLRFMEEIWGPTPAQGRYEPASRLATDLGNTEPGDGKRFKGRGPIQITGRSNYRRFGDLLGAALLDEPARAALPALAFRIAGLFWAKKGLNELADRADAAAFREITRRINGGFNGLDDRQKFYAAARSILGVPDVPAAGADRDLQAPDLSGEPAFARGDEAIRAHRRRSRRRKPASGTRKRAVTRSRSPTAPLKAATKPRTRDAAPAKPATPGKRPVKAVAKRRPLRRTSKRKKS
jgi:putative chitinase